MPAAAKKSTAKKPAGKQTVAAKKPAAKKAPAKAAPSKKAPAKAAPAKKASAKSAPAKKAPAKTVAKKAPAKTVTKKTDKVDAKKAAPSKAAGARKKTVICELSGFEVTPGPANLSPKTLDRLKHKLQEEKQRLLHQADDLAAEAEQLARDREAGDTQFDEESGEGDTINIERERDLLLSASAQQIVDEIDRALERIANGTYGLCLPAGRRINIERLEALPYAETCVDCKARAERRR